MLTIKQDAPLHHLTTIALCLLAACTLGCGRSPNLATAQIKPAETPEGRFWAEFCAANRAWLDPQPGSITLVLRNDRRTHRDSDYLWETDSRIHTWATPEMNVRRLRLRVRNNTEEPSLEDRYNAGLGARIQIPPLKPERKLFNPSWFTARVGTTCWSTLHVFNQTGLPASTVLERPTDTNAPITLRVSGGFWTDLTRMDTALSWESPIYAVHNFAFGGLDCRISLVDEFEVQIDPVTLHPTRMIEALKGRRSHLRVETTFDSEWLQSAAGPVPKHIQVSWTNSHEEDRKPYTLNYEFQIKDGAWVVKETLLDYENWANDRRLVLEEAIVGEIDPANFVIKTDVDLPAESYTELGPGERIVRFQTEDGLTLEGKLSLPPGAAGDVPVVMFLPGAGPWTFDRPVQLPTNSSPLSDTQKILYMDMYARELNARSVAFFRCNKRGCAIIDKSPYELVNRATFSKATPSVLLRDYVAALEALRAQDGIDPDRIVLLGASEGTVMAPRLALASPAGVRGLVLFGYAEDNTHDTIVWQNTVGPWRNVARWYDLDRDGSITPEEWGKAKLDALWSLRFGRAELRRFDTDGNGVVTAADLKQGNAQMLDAILSAVEKRDDDFLWKHLLKLSSAYLLEDWKRPPLHETLLKLNIPIHIFHGEFDGACRVEGVTETEAAFRKTGKTNLTAHILPDSGHDLSYGIFLETDRPPAPFQQLFNTAKELTSPKNAP